MQPYPYGDGGDIYLGGGSSGGGSPYAQYGQYQAHPQHHYSDHAVGDYGNEDEYDEYDDDLSQRAGLLNVMSEAEKLRYARDMTSKNRR